MKEVRLKLQGELHALERELNIELPLAGAFQAPLVKTAGLLQALPRNFAYGLKALIDQKEAAA